MPIKFYLYMIGLSAVLGILWYINSVFDERDELLGSIAVKDQVIEQQVAYHGKYVNKVDESQKLLKVDLQREQTAHEKLQENYSEARTVIDDLRYKLNKHNLEYLAEKKPVLIGNVINRGTARMFKQLREATR